ncbi:MAG TPA: thiamine pyrophosphate-binding protein [Candidatus Acidoferrum sp.]|nr:thiamine pyrophosphate-binding protein [Candidatus Acidoferrum sp.]
MRPETPTPSAGTTLWGSDAIARMIQRLEIPYLAVVPGASFRGLHDSLVNDLGNKNPQMLTCIHEESAVSIAHGYAKASGRMMGAVVHSNVGLLHATMAIFNAWCDRVPMLILGATGPWDAAKRRPWIDWIHTASDQGALVRGYTKWDNQPASIPAVYDALLRGAQMATTAPRAPVYVNLDAALQEQKLDALPTLPDPARFAAPESPTPAPELIQRAATLLSGASAPVILAGRTNRTEASWRARVALAEKLGARVITDIKTGAVFPTRHPLHVGPPGSFLSQAANKALQEADVILALDWIDLAGTFKAAFGDQPPTAKVISASCDVLLHRGFSMDYFGLPPVDVNLLAEPDVVVPRLLEACRARQAAPPPAAAPDVPPMRTGDVMSLRALAEVFNATTTGMDVCLTRLPLGWRGAYRDFAHPLDFLGNDGGGGVGAGPGLTVGAALALRGTGRVPIALLGDGDYLMGVTALWTATHYGIPCLIVICNNRSFYNDEAHQERVAITRGRPVENKWIGQRIGDPDMDLALMAVAQGAKGIGPVTQPEQFAVAMKEGLRAVMDGDVCVIDARVLPGYDTDASGERPPARG